MLGLQNQTVVRVAMWAIVGCWCADGSGQELRIPTENDWPDAGRVDRDIGPLPNSSFDRQRTFYPDSSESRQIRRRSRQLQPDASFALHSDLIEELIRDQRTQSKSISTRVLEANVSGYQSTVTNISVQLVPSTQVAQFHLRAQGNVSSDTVGLTPQAQIRSAGQHTFDLIKPVYFNGQRLLTKRAYGQLQARQIPQNVVSVASAMPLIGPISDRIAWSEVQRRQPLSDSIVVRQIADDVIPQFNSKTDTALADLNRRLAGLKTSFNKAFHQQPKWSASTSTNVLQLNLQAANADSPPTILDASLEGSELAAVLISEAVVNEAIARLPLNGYEFSDADLQQLLTKVKPSTETDKTKLLMTLRDQFSAPALPALLFSIQLANNRPLEVRFQDAHTDLMLRFRIKPKLGTASVLQQATFRLGANAADQGRWSLVVHSVEVTPADAEQLPDTWTGLIQTQLTQLLTNIPDSSFARTIDLKSVNPKLPALSLHRLQAASGYFRASFVRSPQLSSTQ